MAAVTEAISSFGSWAGGWAAAGVSALGGTNIAPIVGAVTSAAVETAVYGAIIGGGVSLATGGNVFKGALTGAAIGGVVGGVVQGGGMAAGVFDTSGEAFKMAGAGGVTQGLSSSSDLPERFPESTQGQGIDMSGIRGEKQPISPPSPPPASTDPTKGLIYAGMGQGLFAGLGAVGVERMKENAAEDTADKTSEREVDTAREMQKLNVAGRYKSQVANIQLPDWWSKYLNPKVATPQPAPSGGLLRGTT